MPDVYKGQGTAQRTDATKYQPTTEFDPPEGYRADSHLADAVNTALFLEQPLLVTGDPGTGKTQLANSIAWELGLPLHVFHAKTSSVANDLFYRYDALLHFRDAQAKERQDLDVSKYIRFEALGRAILASTSAAALSDSGLPRSLVDRFAKSTRSVVLIDEIDKAPRDFPNDILHEIERLSFEVREAEWRRFSADKACRPYVILTSNLEKTLPDAFLRRCVFYYIESPPPEELLKIVDSRLAAATTPGGPGSDTAVASTSPAPSADPLTKAAVSYFVELRDRHRLVKRPATAELLAWLRLLQHLDINEEDVTRKSDRLRRTLPVLLKHIDDLQLMNALPSRSAP